MIDTKIKDLIPKEIYMKLQELLGGNRIYIPKRTNKDRVKDLYFENNYSIKRIAKLLDINKSQVYKIINQIKSNDQ